MTSQRQNNELSRFIEDLASNGQYTFSFSQIANTLKISNAALRKVLSRGLKKNLIVSPVKGFYIVVPAEYMSLGCLPAAEFIPHLMSYWKEDYYIGLLSAASMHGAAHHAPMTFQVMTSKIHRNIIIGKVSVNFYKSKYVNILPTVSRNTKKSIMKVSTPETTAFDLVANFKGASGFNNMINLLNELAEILQPRRLLQVSKLINETTYIQRLGYILDTLGFSKKSSVLLKEVNRRTNRYVLLVPYVKSKNVVKNAKWKIIENEKVDLEI